MDNILDDLEELTQPDSSSPEYRALQEEMVTLEAVLQKQISPEVMEQLGDIRGRLTDLECRECFRRGFRLGAAVMLAVLTPPGGPGSPDTRRSSFSGQ